MGGSGIGRTLVPLSGVQDSWTDFDGTPSGIQPFGIAKGVSHAANNGDWSMDAAVDVFHLLATSLWVGLVLVAGGLPRPASARPDRLDAGSRR